MPSSRFTSKSIHAGQRLAHRALLGLALLAAVVVASAQAWPDRPITLVVP